MAKDGDEVLKEFVRRVNALLDRLQKAAGLGGPMNQADPRKTSGVTLDLGRSTIFRATLPTPSAWCYEGPDGPQTIDELFDRQHQYADAKMWEITGY